MIHVEDVTFTYDGEPDPILRDVSFTVPEGELALVVGRTGSGKSTLLRAINGLVPHFTGGHLIGRVRVGERDTRTSPPREFAGTVGVVGQDPEAGFVTDTVEEELAYTMEQLAIAPQTMRKRVEETLDLLGIAELRSRPLRSLSGGQQQRLAIGSVLTAQPRVLVLDEPTSALDPTAAEEVLAAIQRLVHDLGLTAIVAEHRMERVVQFADRVLYVPGDGSVEVGDPAQIFARTDVAPPVVELGRLAGWHPLPLSVRDARRQAGPLRERLDVGAARTSKPTPASSGSLALSARGVTVSYGALVAVRDVDLELPRGSIVALMGRNGSGKSTLLWSMQGSGRRDRGTVSVRQEHGDPVDPMALNPSDARRLVGLVPQSASDLLYHQSVAAECEGADIESEASPGTCAAILESLVPGISPSRHPRDLSEGQKLALVLAIQLTAAPGIILLDEPTRGLDYPAKADFTQRLRELAAAGHTVLVATHDVEFVAESAHRVVVMAQGEIVADGPTREVIGSSPAFAPQVAKILAPLEYLTVAEVADALAAPEPGLR